MDTTNTETTIHSLATEMASWFESRTRDNGTTFLTLRDNHPKWIQQVCFDAHKSPTIGTIMPEDYRHEMINECLDIIAECTNEDQLENAKWDGLTAPDYTYDLIQWLASHNARAVFCDESKQEIGDAGDLIGQIRDGYVYEIREVFDLVVSALNRILEDR